MSVVVNPHGNTRRNMRLQYPTEDDIALYSAAYTNPAREEVIQSSSVIQSTSAVDNDNISNDSSNSGFIWSLTSDFIILNIW